MTKKEQKKYRTGKPDRAGTYNCLVNDEPKVLVWHQCHLTGAGWWMTPDGFDVFGDVKWTE